MNRVVIQARRDALSAQLDQATQQYDQLEAALKTLDRQLCAMAGGVQELDALLVQADSEPPRASTTRERLIGYVLQKVAIRW